VSLQYTRQAHLQPSTARLLVTLGLGLDPAAAAAHPRKTAPAVSVANPPGSTA
jgi:hypothetical protein